MELGREKLQIPGEEKLAISLLTEAFLLDGGCAAQIAKACFERAAYLYGGLSHGAGGAEGAAIRKRCSCSFFASTEAFRAWEAHCAQPEAAVAKGAV